MQRLLLQRPDAVSIQVEVLEGRQPFKSVPMDLRNLVLVQENCVQMHFSSERVGADLSYMVVPQIAGMTHIEGIKRPIITFALPGWELVDEDVVNARNERWSQI